MNKAKALNQLRDGLQPHYTLNQFDQLLKEYYGYGLKQWVDEIEKAGYLAILPNIASVFLLVSDNWHSTEGSR